MRDGLSLAASLLLEVETTGIRDVQQARGRGKIRREGGD